MYQHSNYLNLNSVAHLKLKYERKSAYVLTLIS